MLIIPSPPTFSNLMIVFQVTVMSTVGVDVEVDGEEEDEE